MKTLAEQISGRCTHFTGIRDDNGRCRAGVVYLTVKNEQVRGFGAYPCFREGEAVPCANRNFPTPEEVAAKVAEHDASWERLKLGIGAASEDAKKHGFGRGKGGNGFVLCPVCNKGDLHYAVSGYNGHMRGRCTTNDCVSWMQ